MIRKFTLIKIEPYPFKKPYLMKHYILISALIFLINIAAVSQINRYGLPEIKNYSVKEYRAYSQNWVSVQNQYGILYFGNNEGILEYDGVGWNLIPINKGAIIKSLAVDSLNTIYVGAENEFGIIAYDRNHDQTYTSLSDSLPKEEQNFSAVYKIYIEKDGILFCTNKKIFKHTEKGFEIIKMPEGGFFTHKTGEDFYMGDYYEGLMKLNKNKFEKCVGGELYIEKDIMAALKLSPDEVLFATALNGLYIYNKKTGKSRQPDSKSYPILHNILVRDYLYSAFENNDEYYMITLYGGTLVCDKDFNILEHYDYKSGVNDEITLSGFKSEVQSRNSSLWLCLNNGISKVDVNSKFKKFNELNGLENEVLNITEFKGNIYLSTSNGVYFIDKTDPYSIPKFVHIKNTEGQCWSFVEKNQHLFVGSFDIYDIVNQETKVIKPKNQVFKLLSSETNENTIYAGTEKGLWIYKLINNDLIPEKRIEGLNNHIINIVESESGDLWISTNNNELFKITFNKQDTLVTEYKNNPEFKNIKSLSIFKYKKNIYFSTDRELYVLNENKKGFEVEQYFPSDVHSAFIKIIHFNEDKNGNIFAVKSNNNFHKLVYIENNNGKLKSNITETSELRELIILNIFSDSEGVLWIGTNEGLYTFRINSSGNYHTRYYTLIRNIVNNEKVINYTFNENFLQHKEYEFPYKDNSITFSFASPYFINEKNTLYTTFLEGFDNNWSKPSDITFKEYTNLREGKYIFKVKAVNIFGIESETAEYAFKISAPWYRTIYAYITYILFFTGFVWLLVKLNTNRLRHEKYKLEQIVKERTAEIVQQKEEIQAIADNLKSANDEISGKNELLRQKNQHITESIEYASKIQKALLPPSELIEELLPEHFILYKPRDIVSGDFYWLKKIGNYTVYAAADCTGHGVPGAFMSMLGISFLNEIVTKSRFDKPGKILDKLRKKVKTSLRQTGKENESKDGMDIALCIIDHETDTLEFAGAYNPVYIIRKGELTEINATRNPIGIYLKEKDFETHEFKLEKGDILYTFSDGYTDQFGGDNDSKLKTKNFKKILIEIYDKPMSEQKQILEDTFIKWKGNTEQTDDIIIFGVKV